MKRTDIKGCAACRGLDHGVRSCESAEAVAYWRNRAAQCTAPGSKIARAINASQAAVYEQRADAIERRLSGVSRVTEGSPRLPGRVRR